MALLGELEGAFQSKRYVGNHADAAALVELLRVHGRVVEDPVEIEPDVLADPRDDFVVALARAAEAHVIVTGDRHLLEPADLRPEPVTPRQFMILLERHGF